MLLKLRCRRWKCNRFGGGAFWRELGGLNSRKERIRLISKLCCTMISVLMLSFAVRLEVELFNNPTQNSNEIWLNSEYDGN